MARTPLLRALRQLAGEHDAAEQLGVSVEEVRARHAEAAYSRKDFLKRAGAAGAVLAAAGPAGALVRTARGATAPRIAIVGGGIAGLTTALTLQDRGIGSTVYEAHPSRIGGRMHSDFVDFPGYWANGQGAELCGELIDTGHKTILALARRFNLATVDLLGAEPNGSTDTYRFFGDYYPTDEADRDFKAIRAALHRDLSVASYPTTYKISTPEGIALDNMSIYEWIESRVPGRPLVAVRPAARRRLQHRVRRRDDRAVRAQPRLPAGLLRRRPLALRPVRRALPHRRRQHPAPARDPRLDRAVAGRFGRFAWAGG